MMLIHGNPVVELLLNREPFGTWLRDSGNHSWETNSALISLRYPAYIIHFISYLLVGLLMDYTLRFVQSRRIY
ncbi:hypothetical protein Q5741_15325 [Paenibacillus sp. JX-17]|uniref:Uncharacterized protein n=2 Tax=Paenibacillus lacisoli TaxID=3064525 RepID=A0ABT9CIL4_9BACL|nr:hypothetical protein [Paenibacillus sp. JX-17]